MDGLSLEALLARVSVRDRRAFSILYDRTSAVLFGICLRILEDRAEAEEALQDTYIKVWRKAATFAQGHAPAMAWLIAITRNTAIDRVRRTAMAPVALSETLSVPDAAPSPEDSAIASDDHRHLAKCLEELDAPQAEIIRHAFFTGCTYAQLAEATQTPLGTIKSWVRRSLIKLRQCLDTLPAHRT